MNTRCISVMVILILILSCPGFAGQANSQPSGTGAAQIATLALDAVAAEPASSRPADWPVTSADILAGYRPYNDWLDAERWFMLAHLEKAAQKTPAINVWLHEEHPLQKAQMRFELQSMLGLRSQFGTVSQEAWDGGPLTDEKLAQFIESLSPAQKAALQANYFRLPISDLTAAQKEQMNAFFPDMPSVNRSPVINLPDASLYFRFQFYVSAKIRGNPETFETLVSSF